MPIRSVVQIVNDRFVPIRVNADRRPDISDRYSLGGWPTTAFLTADGEVIGGGTYVTVDRMPSVLERVVVAFKSRSAEFTTAPGHTESRSDVEPADADLAAMVFETFDAEHGGFGTAPKFPLIAPLQLALDIYRETEDQALAHLVEVSLDGMGWSELHDDVDGGFFRCATTRDWKEPRREKLLDVNASLLRIYVEASETLRIARYRERAEDVLRFTQTWLADAVDGGWSGSQQADRAYYAAHDGRAPRGRRPDGRRRALCRVECADGVGHASRRRGHRRHGARRVRAEVARADGRRLLQPRRRDRALSRRPANDDAVLPSAGSSTIRSRWPPRTSTPMRRPATSSTR